MWQVNKGKSLAAIRGVFQHRRFGCSSGNRPPARSPADRAFRRTNLQRAPRAAEKAPLLAFKTSNAFTLVELLVVLAIVATLAGLATTGFVMSVQARSTDHFVKELTAYLRFIQSKAIEEGKTHKLITEEPGTLSVLIQDEAASDFHPVSNLVSKRFEHEKNFTVRLTQGHEIYFFPDGVMTRNKLMVSDVKGERAAIEIKNRIGAFQVTINE